MLVSSVNILTQFQSQEKSDFDHGIASVYICSSVVISKR